MVTFVLVRAVNSPTDLPAKIFELLSKKLWANQECKVMFPLGLTLMYQTVTAESQRLSSKLKVAAQEGKKIVPARN